MTFTTEVEINLPRERVVELFDDPANLRYWQPGFMSMEHLGGQRGEEGAVSLLKYRTEKGDIELVQTITKKELPHKLYGIYESKGVWNGVRNHFHKIKGNKTKWKSHVEYRFKGKMKFQAIFSSSTFKKQSQQQMDYFRDFAERSR